MVRHRQHEKDLGSRVRRLQDLGICSSFSKPVGRAREPSLAILTQTLRELKVKPLRMIWTGGGGRVGKLLNLMKITGWRRQPQAILCHPFSRQWAISECIA